jgi:multiple sugar transport system ATP-binding protein
MRKGELQQVADPQTLYDHPVNLFVGGFIGSPSMNMIEATLASTNGTVSAKLGNQVIELPADTVSSRPALKQFDGKPVILGIRPEDLEDVALASDTPGNHRLGGKATLTEALGSEIMVHFTMDAKQAMTDEVKELAADSGNDRVAEQGIEQPHASLVGRFGARSRVRLGDELEIAVDTRALHFFDPQTGMGIYDGTEGKGANQ